MKTKLLFVILLGILTVSCQKDESSAVVEEQENVNNNGNQNNTEPEKDSVVIVTEGNVVEHAFTRAAAAPLVVTLTEQEKEMIESGYPFAVSIFEKQIAMAGDENVCISPLSVQLLLGILTNGLNDTTAARMMEIMFGPDVTVQDMNSGYGKLSASLEATNCAKLSNALWMQKGQTFNNDFLAVGQGIYHSTVKYLDFDYAQSAMDTICQWAYDNSYGRLKNLDVGDLNTNTIMVVGNLTWFASAWAYAFSTSNTTKGKFTLADGSVKEVDMMCMETRRGVKYKVLDKYKVLSMPFVNNAFRMDFYVPNSEYTLDEVIPEFDWSVKPSGGTVKIQMPKFTMECKNDIRQLLESCGMKEMFNVGVFDRMTSKDNDANIQNIKQDVKIKVEESGVEAVAVTLGFLDTRSGPYNFDIDRPFVFAIRDNASGSFLFMGRVNNIN